MSIIILGRGIRPQEVVCEEREPSLWRRVAQTLSRWIWGAFCCGVPGVPCYFCISRERIEAERQLPDTAIEDNPMLQEVRLVAVPNELEIRRHRPHSPAGRKSSPEMLVAVRCALSDLQGEPGALKDYQTLKKLSDEPG